MSENTDEPTTDGAFASQAGPPPPRRYGGTRILPRIEVGRPKSQPTAPPIAGLRESDDAPEPAAWAPADLPTNDPRNVFAPRTFGGGRIRVYGCSPGCLLLSLLVSLALMFMLRVLF
jgi:hypothetical protein